MPKEIEHKFLVRRRHLPKLAAGKSLIQGYLSTRPTVRVRIVSNAEGSTAYLTIKGPGGISRDEFEYEIPVEHAREMLALCGALVVEKTRYEMDGWEIDEFQGRHHGLWLAEYEMDSIDEKLPPLPEWIGTEVTGDPNYTNGCLAVYGLEKIDLNAQ